MSTGCSFNSLPFEQLTNLFLYLSGEDLGRISQVCMKFRDAAYIDSLWKRRCQIEYDVDTSHLQECWQSYREMYGKVLKKHGYLLGTWMLERIPLGGLIHVKFDGGTIIGEEYLSPKIPHLTDPLRFSHKHFETVLMDDGTVDLQGCEMSKDAKTYKIKKVAGNGVDTVTLMKDSRGTMKAVPPALLSQWISEECDVPVSHLHSFTFFFEVQERTVLGRRIEAYKSNWSKDVTLWRVTVAPVVDHNAPIAPGLFVGEYSIHGYEILRLEYTEDCRELHAIKITGDPNIPAGEVSVKVDLSRPIVLTENQQVDMQNLTDIDIPDVLPSGGGVANLPSQPFQVPRGCTRFCEEWKGEVSQSMGSGLAWKDIKLPKICKARYHCKGHVAAKGFKHDTYIPGHWIMFSEDLFGVLWIPFKSLSLYSRSELPLS